MAFWAMQRVMRIQRRYFIAGSTAMAETLDHFSNLMRTLDPALYAHLHAAGASDFNYCFRWFILNLRREFSFSDALVLFEVSWAVPSAELCRNELGKGPFILFAALAIFQLNRDAFLAPGIGAEDIIYLTGSLSGQMHVRQVLDRAVALLWSVVRTKYLPPT